MVRLKERGQNYEFEHYVYFNSNMVRLKAIINVFDSNNPLTFQFQYGSIKSTNSVGCKIQF